MSRKRKLRNEHRCLFRLMPLWCDDFATHRKCLFRLMTLWCDDIATHRKCLFRLMPLWCDDIATYRKCLFRLMLLWFDDIFKHQNRHPPTVSSDPVAHSQRLYLHIIAHFYQKQHYLITFIVELQTKKILPYSLPSCSYLLFQYSFLPVFLLHAIGAHLFPLQSLTCRFALQFITW